MMKKRDIYILTFGITALYQIYSIEPSFTFFINNFFDFGINPNPPKPYNPERLVALIPSIILFFASILLWLNAGKIADSILRRNSATLPQGNWTLEEILILSVIITGILLLLGTLQTFPWTMIVPLFFPGISLPRALAQNLSHSTLQFAVSIIKILFSLYFISRPKRIVSMLTDRIQDQSMAD